MKLHIEGTNKQTNTIVLHFPMKCLASDIEIFAIIGTLEK